MESGENNNHGNHSMRRPKKRNDSLDLPPVSVDEYGEGLPYAPIDWPEPGDVWGWKAGRRINVTGFHKDRYLYLPERLCKLESANRNRIGFKSLVSVERYIRTTFPGSDVAAFLASFSWKMRAKEAPFPDIRQKPDLNLFDMLVEEVPVLSDSDSESNCMACRANNRNCSSLLPETEKPTSALSPCDLCCSEPHFCRHCCCILCCKRIDSKYEGYSYIKCESPASNCSICGHIAHVNCALQCYMAGTVGGDIGLDAEYYCRRCDARTDLIPQVERMLQTCESIKSPDDIESILKVGVLVLCGSEKIKAKMLLKRIESVFTQLKCGASLEDIWTTEKVDSASSTVDNDNENVELALVKYEAPLEVSPVSRLDLPTSYDNWGEFLELENEIDHVLRELRESQELEYKTAEQKLNAQKNHLRSLFQQLDRERDELSRRTSEIDPSASLNAVLDRVDQIKQQIKKVKEMEEVALGFGRTRSRILTEHFDMANED